VSEGPAPRLTVYSRLGCHLCEQMIEALREACGSHPFDVIDIDGDPALASRYGTSVPVLVADGREISRYHLDHEALRRVLRRS
jgi:hypothetical protein